jgi:hypothetical protein
MKIFKRQLSNREIMVVGILMLFMSGNGMISAKAEKPGAMLVVQKKDGQTIKGELLTVKNGTLNLLIYENASKVDVLLNELSSLHIEKKSAFLKGLKIGVLSGAATGALLGMLMGEDIGGGRSSFSMGMALWSGISFGGVGGAIGGIAGALKGIDKSITLDGMSPEKLRRVEAKLSSQARYRPDPTAELQKASLQEPE